MKDLKLNDQYIGYKNEQIFNVWSPLENKTGVKIILGKENEVLSYCDYYNPIPINQYKIVEKSEIVIFKKIIESLNSNHLL